MLEWLEKVRHVQHLVGGARKYYLPASVSFLKRQEVIWVPDSEAVDVLQLWEEELVPQLKYGFGFAIAARQVMVCRGGTIQVELFDGERRERVSLAYGHVLYIPPCLWYTYFTKSAGVKRKDHARIEIFTDADLRSERWFCRMPQDEYATLRRNMRR